MRPSHQVTQLSQFGRILWTVEYNNNRSSANNMIIIGNQEKKKKKKTQYRIKENYQCFNFKPIIKNQEGKKSVWDPISKPLSRFLHLPIIVIPKNLEQPQKLFANQVVMEGGVRPKPSHDCRFRRRWSLRHCGRRILAWWLLSLNVFEFLVLWFIFIIY